MALVGAHSLILILLLAVALSGCTKEERYEEQEFFSTSFGRLGSGHMARSGESDNGSIRFPAAGLDGATVAPIRACLFAQYAKEPTPLGGRGAENPFRRAGGKVEEPPLGRNFGRTTVAALLYGGVRTVINFEEMNGASDWHNGGVRFNFDAFGDRTNGPLPLPQLPVHMASWGNATFEVAGNEIADPVSGVPPNYDPNEDQLNWTADFYLVKSGIRDNATKAMHDLAGGIYDPSDPRDAKVERGDYEAHLFLYSREGTPKATPRTFRGPQPVIAERPYSTEFSFQNTWYPGKVTLVYRVTTPGPTLQTTDLTFRVLDADLNVLSRTTLGGVAGASDSKTVTVSLDHPLQYRILVAGNATGATFEIAATFSGEASLFWFWWEDVVAGKAAASQYSKCAYDLLGDTFRPLPIVIDTPKAPTLALIYVILGVAGASLYGLFLTKLVMDQVSTGDFKRRFRKR